MSTKRTKPAKAEIEGVFSCRNKTKKNDPRPMPRIFGLSSLSL
jgi:hypothetical protein